MNRIKELRKKAGIKQIDLCKQLKVSQAALSGWENGKYEPDLTSLTKMAEIFNVTVNYLLGVPEPEQRQFKCGVNIPVLGTVQAGIPIEAVQDIIDYEELNPEMLEHGEEYFALQVKGDSMQPKMDAGDVVIVRKQSDVAHGDTAIVLVNGSEATIKRVLKQEAGIMLAPNNPAYETKFYSNKEIADLPVVILGKVVELRAKF